MFTVHLAEIRCAHLDWNPVGCNKKRTNNINEIPLCHSFIHSFLDTANWWQPWWFRLLDMFICFKNNS